MRLVFLLALTLLAATALAAEEPLQLPGPDGYLLDAVVTTPDGPVRQVVVLVHGSGPAGLDHDLAAVTEGQQPNLLFKDMADALVAQGMAVLRYNKRTYQFQQDAAADPAFADSPHIASFKAEPLQQLIADVAAMAAHARERFPDAKVVLLGVSQGTYLALQVAHTSGGVDGLVLVGFYLTSLDTLILEQTVWRPLSIFADLDTSGDQFLDTDELKAGGQIGMQLGFQLPQLDLDQDNRYSLDEFKGANLSNLVIRDILGPEYRIAEATLPRPAEILGAIEVPVLFCQGEWDNQTPAYHARSVQITNKLVWQKPNLHFRFYAERGHILDPREKYDDLVYRPADQAILAEMAGAMGKLFQ